MSVLVVGSVALDSIETPQEQRTDILGGSASFFSYTASFLTPVQLVAVVGQDFPEEHIELLRQQGVDLAGLQRAPGRTFRWSGRYLPDMVNRQTLDTQLNVFETFRPQLPEAFRDTSYLFLANIHPQLQLEVLQQVRAPKLVACDTMNFWIDGQLSTLRQVLRSIDVLLLNDEEVRSLAGEHNLAKAAAAVQSMGPRRVIVKRGDAGALLFDEEGLFWAPAYPTETVVDPTGAGDSFAGGFVSFLAYHDEINATRLRQAVIYGSAMASFCVEDFSLARFTTIKREDVVARCANFCTFMKFEDIRL